MLTDLDELLLTVRDPNSREYLREAIAAYRSGANRAAVVAVWVAVIFDIITKLRILDSQGDAAAHSLVEKLDAAIAAQDVKALAKLEESLPEEARKTFEFLNLIEYEDLLRLKTDRNRCAHPAYSGDALLYAPSLESLRAHIVHAVTHLLSRPPVQGKSAIDRFMADVVGPFFPTDQESVNRYLSRYLDHAKPSLVSNLIAIIIKALLRRDNPQLAGHETSVALALTSISYRHPDIYRAKMQELMRTLTPGLEDTDIIHLFDLLTLDASIWPMLDEPTRMKTTHIARNYDLNTMPEEILLKALAVEPLSALVRERLHELDGSVLLAYIQRYPRPELADEAIRLFESPVSFRDAEAKARLALLTLGKHLLPSQIRKALEAVPTRTDIWDATGMPGILRDFFSITQPHHATLKAEWENMMNQIMRKVLEGYRFGDSSRRPWNGLTTLMQSHGFGPFDWEATLREMQSEPRPLYPPAWTNQT